MALNLVIGDATIGVQGEGFSYIFSTAIGGMESLHKYGKEWLYRAPKPTFWRATTDNDRGNGFSYQSSAWLAVDCFLRCQEIQASMDGKPIEIPLAPANNQYGGKVEAKEFAITFVYGAAAIPEMRTEAAYRVTEDGAIHVQVHYFGKENLPELPVFGMRFLMPTPAVGYEYEGLSGETYPDRMAGGILGNYEIEGMPVTPYLVPQDCGVHMETRWVGIHRTSELDNTKRGQDRKTLYFKGEEGKTFAFSCLPYTAEELENATHQEELPPAHRTVVSILGAVRGVGGINSWGADVEELYHISGEKDIVYGFVIE